MTEILLAVESAESRSLPLSAQRLVNYFTERQRPDAKSQVPLFGVPGLTQFATCGVGPIRGLWVMNEVLYAVSGSEIYSIDAAGIVKLLGSGIQGTALVSMADNGTEICIVTGPVGNGYIYTVANGLVQITSANFNGANTVEFFDEYFVFDWPQTNKFYLSGLLNGNSFNGLDFASAEATPGFVVATIQNLQLLFIFCVDHIELWYDAGTNDFPFQRYTGGVLNYGCVSPQTIIKQDGAIFFLGADKVFYRLQGNVPIRVSTHEMEHIFAGDADLTTASCLTYTLEGHKMVALTLPSSNRTLEFDISTGRWHERESWDENNVTLGRWRANCCAQAYGNNYVGDAFNGNVSLIDWTVYTELGNTLRGLIHSAPLHKDKLRIFVNRFELDVQAGVGLTTGQGSDPQIMMRYSKDGGETFSKIQPWRSLGKIGQRLKRLRWLSLGQAYQWVFQLTITDPVPRVIITTHCDWEAGMP